MSRSYKKPWYTDRNPFMKAYANRRVRKNKNIPNGKKYKQITNPWDICDWKFFCPEDERAYRK